MRLFDLHCDTLYECYTKKYPLSKNNGHVDLARAAAYAPYGQMFAVWVPEGLKEEESWRLCRAVLQRAAEEERHSNGQIHFLCKGESLSGAFDRFPAVGMLAVEGGAALGGRLERVEELAAMGVRYMTLTWNGSNALGNGCLSGQEAGLTAFGRAVVQRMAAVGMTVDVSHLNEAGFWDVAEMVTVPFLATHSNAAAVCPHPRNLTDGQFDEIVQHGGLVGINLCGDFLGEATFAQVERHLVHFWEHGGENTVCFGGDWDGTSLPEEWNGLAVMQEIGAYLYRKNYDSDLLSRLFFGNCYNFFSRL